MEYDYQTPKRKLAWFPRTFPSLCFYPQIIKIVWTSNRLARRGGYSTARWVEDSQATLNALERVGVQLDIYNREVMKRCVSPCVFVGNHMSTLETFILPCVIQPIKNVTFVVKQNLVETPFFKHIMISRHPIVVGRENPRDDMVTVLKEGQQRLADGLSVIVFPQTTRMSQFNRNQFNSIGVKLARRAGVPVIPFALQTDTWGNGRWIKEMGKIDPDKIAHIHFGEPLPIVTSTGKEEQEKIIHFIEMKLDSWQAKR